MDILRELLEENIPSLLTSGIFWVGYYILSKFLDEHRDDLQNFMQAPRIRDFHQLSLDFESECPYAILEGQIHPNSTAINSLYEPFTKGVVRTLITWKLKKIWNVFTRNWDMSSSLHSSSESNVPMHLTDKNNCKIYVQDFSEVKRHDLLKQVSNITEPVDDPMLKKILDNILQNEVVVGYERIESMLKVGTNVIICGKLTKELDGLKYIFRVSKPQSPYNYRCTALSYDEFLASKILNVDVLRFLTISLGVIFGALVSYLIIKSIKRLFEKLKERRESEEFRINMLIPDISDRTDDEIIQNTSTGQSGSLVCTICYERPVRVLVKPCNHACLCTTCATKVEGLCPICRVRISKFEKVFFP
ncbi:Mitochondrial ubiquitin ligase activator of nfkb 1 [Oopsacas minuta]|uniref:RING-type E3 ubiquitin transferase n=1 Tax=Oopsacas minuta TaxID=111878 RepID=A0AAV7K641_9METZ|nr:Mitochondrial ubiquitin ligase activator of nfkb 1 [Oopsacas minuta]